MELDGGAAGLLHISQVIIVIIVFVIVILKISYDRIDNLERVFTLGQKAKVVVIIICS